MKVVKIMFRGALYALLAFAGAVAAVNIWVGVRTKDFIFDDISALPANKTGLLLGTTPFQKGGKSNPFFENRIAAAAELYNAKKILNIIVSGDNRSPYYNEPEEMRRRSVTARALSEAPLVLIKPIPASSVFQLSARLAVLVY